ncbi:MAG: glycoside hydrolase family 130 protein [Planctomycetes bacterium]|nr:glycoside hydrolase family 130 protein [Planctomycetota bacterium]
MKRSSANPILTRADIPDVPPRLVDATSVFNPGAIVHGGETVLLLRVQARSRETFLMVARSPDGVRFRVEPRLVAIDGLGDVGERVHHVYDPRLTRDGDDVLVMFAADTDAGCRLGIARTRDFERFDLVAFGRDEDTRNGVLFPERFDGRWLRLERPNRVALDGGPTSGDEIVLAESDDLVHWRTTASVLRGRWRYWDERIGSGPPPVRTAHGWLHVYHGVATHFQSANIYQAGAVLLDRRDPSRVLVRTGHNVLEPRELYELVGQVPNVVFPSGLCADRADPVTGVVPDDAELRIYYGAADTCVGLATTTVAELIADCHVAGPPG